jgi:hypothetical protein
MTRAMIALGFGGGLVLPGTPTLTLGSEDEDSTGPKSVPSAEPAEPVTPETVGSQRKPVQGS